MGNDGGSAMLWNGVLRAHRSTQAHHTQNNQQTAKPTYLQIRRPEPQQPLKHQIAEAQQPLGRKKRLHGPVRLADPFPGPVAVGFWMDFFGVSCVCV